MSRRTTKSILSRDEISLLLYSEETKNTKIYGNLYEVLVQIKDLKAISLDELNKYNLNDVGRAALSYNKNTLMDNVKGEWYVEADSAEDVNKKVRCGLCNTPNKYLFYIRNRINNARLNVGSFCMTKFPGIEGYTEYKYHLEQKIKNQKIAFRRTEFHNKIPNPDKPEKFILYISPLCYSKEKGGFPLCYLRINTSIKFTASLPVMTA